VCSTGLSECEFYAVDGLFGLFALTRGFVAAVRSVSVGFKEWPFAKAQAIKITL
jgi:hypothetical protein